MKRNLMDNINLVVGFIGSIISIITFVGSHFAIKLPKLIIDLDYLCSKYGEYMFIMFFSLFIVALYNIICRNKIYEKYNKIICYFQDIIIYDKKVNYKELSELIIDMYPYRHKSKINLVITWDDDTPNREEKLIYDTANYDEWWSNINKWYYRLLGLKHVNWRIDYLWLKHANWKKAYKLMKRRTFHIFIRNEQNSIASLRLYGSKRAFTRRKKKIMKSFSYTIEIFMYIVLCSDEFKV